MPPISCPQITHYHVIFINTETTKTCKKTYKDEANLPQHR